MRTTLTLDDDVAEAARLLARETGKPLGTVISKLARRGLRPDLTPICTVGLPHFSVTKDAELIPADRASRLVDEDGSLSPLP